MATQTIIVPPRFRRAKAFRLIRFGKSWVLKIEIAPRAGRDLISVRRYIAKDNPAAAGRTLLRIRRAVDNLSLILELERPWEGGSTRGLSVASVSYRVKDDVISVLTVWHTSRLLPKLDSE